MSSQIHSSHKHKSKSRTKSKQKHSNHAFLNLKTPTFKHNFKKLNNMKLVKSIQHLNSRGHQKDNGQQNLQESVIEELNSLVNPFSKPMKLFQKYTEEKSSNEANINDQFNQPLNLKQIEGHSNRKIYLNNPDSNQKSPFSQIHLNCIKVIQEKQQQISYLVDIIGQYQDKNNQNQFKIIELESLCDQLQDNLRKYQQKCQEILRQNQEIKRHYESEVNRLNDQFQKSKVVGQDQIDSLVNKVNQKIKELNHLKLTMSSKQQESFLSAHLTTPLNFEISQAKMRQKLKTFQSQLETTKGGNFSRTTANFVGSKTENSFLKMEFEKIELEGDKYEKRIDCGMKMSEKIEHLKKKCKKIQSVLEGEKIRNKSVSLRSKGLK